ATRGIAGNGAVRRAGALPRGSAGAAISIHGRAGGRWRAGRVPLGPGLGGLFASRFARSLPRWHHARAAPRLARARRWPSGAVQAYPAVAAVPAAAVVLRISRWAVS